MVYYIYPQVSVSNRNGANKGKSLDKVLPGTPKGQHTKKIIDENKRIITVHTEK